MCNSPRGITAVASVAVAGSVIFKAVMRFVGTVLGGAAGLGATYFTLLCNGLNYDNRPQKVRWQPIAVHFWCGGFVLLRPCLLRRKTQHCN